MYLLPCDVGCVELLQPPDDILQLEGCTSKLCLQHIVYRCINISINRSVSHHSMLTCSVSTNAFTLSSSYLSAIWHEIYRSELDTLYVIIQLCRKLNTILIQVSSSVYVCAKSGWTNTITFSATVQQHRNKNGANRFSLQAVLGFQKFSKQLDEVGPGLKNLLYFVKQLAKYTNKYKLPVD